ncbi:MAG: 3-oxoacyl-ACP reductase FabG [Spirochaetes bacterium]|nr:3-oxoacyl-ACP reductase FabG [Spirochaetota bacterium]
MSRKRALVTGGSRGIGKSISLMLAKNDYDVIINYRSDEKSAMQTLEEINQKKTNQEINSDVQCHLLKFDISDFAKTQSIIEEEISKNGPLDVLVLNAGIRKDSLFPVMPENDWDSVIDINLKSFYYITKPISRSMFEQRKGKIVVISSTSGQTGMPGQANYCGAKAGIIGAAKGLAVELARRNINVNVVAPGFIETDMTEDLKSQFSELKKQIPIRRIGSGEDVANAVEFLISDKASYIVGEVIAVNGGLLT